MKFTALEGFEHDSAHGIGILIVNVGTPAAPTTAAVRKYLREFLWDARMVEVPRLLWWLVLNFIILINRPRKTARAYKQIWRADGSPLMVFATRQRQKLQDLLRAECKAVPITVALGMRYGEPSVAAALRELRTYAARKILVLPMYPQYCAATTASSADAVFAELATWRWQPELRIINHYHDSKKYIAALANSIRAHRKIHSDADILLMSFHGMPQSYFAAGDPYHCECSKTARLLAEELNLTPEQWKLTFQSRVGAEKWLQPYTDDTLRELPKQGIRRVQVICPGFSVDCLETLEEIAIANREIFMHSGGESYQYIACLNDSNEHMQMLKDLVRTNISDWLAG